MTVRRPQKHSQRELQRYRDLTCPLRNRTMATATDLPLELWVDIFKFAYHERLYGHNYYGDTRLVELEDALPWSLPQLAICRHLFAAAKSVYLSKMSLHMCSKALSPDDGEGHPETCPYLKGTLAQHPHRRSKIRHLDIILADHYGSSGRDGKHLVDANDVISVVRHFPWLVSCGVDSFQPDHWDARDLGYHLPQWLQRLNLASVKLTSKAIAAILALPCLTHLYLFDITSNQLTVTALKKSPPTRIQFLSTAIVPQEVTVALLKQSPNLVCFESSSAYAGMGFSEICASVPDCLSTARLSCEAHPFNQYQKSSIQLALMHLLAVPGLSVVDLCIELLLVADGSNFGLFERLIALLSRLPPQLKTLRLLLTLARSPTARPDHMLTSALLSPLLAKSLLQTFFPPHLESASCQPIVPFKHLKVLSVLSEDEIDFGPTWSQALEEVMVQERGLRKPDGALWCREDFSHDNV